jgi:type II secretory pathway component PulF
VKGFLLEIQSSLAKGQPFYQTFARYPKTFSPVFVNLVKAAEASGRLQQTFDSLSTSMQKEAELRGKVQGALLYPLILLGVAVTVLIFLSLFALPKIADIFLQSGIKPPLFSRVIFTIGLFFGAHVGFILTVLTVAVGFGIYFFGFTLSGRRLVDRMLSETPFVKTIYYNLAIQRFASTFSALMRANLPIIQTTEITAEVVGSQKLKESLLRVAHDGLAKGLTIGEAFRREPVFPKVVTNLIAVSEKAGHIDEVLQTISEFYQTTVEENLKTLVSILEPALLVGMGLIAGVIAAAIILPIYQLTSQF